jgi:nucleoside-diphosphate-sugar epimerase/uncharacterized protein YfkK (UPF0435 family)
MSNSQSSLVITGASGFIGRHLVLALADRFQLYCLARRSQKEAGVHASPNIHWIQADITDKMELHRVKQLIDFQADIDAVLHLAGYYDFSQKDDPAYEATNVTGTYNIIDLAHKVRAQHFIFSSSLAACEFTPAGQVVDESTPVSADFPYARSKRRAEAIIKKLQGDMQASIVRLAAVYSDWCEFPPLYSLLEAWLSRSPLSRALGGQGKFAIPYIHVHDVIDALCKIMSAKEKLPSFGVYNLSPNGSTSHKELYRAATRYYFSRDHKALHIPKPLVCLGLHVQNALFWMVNKEPFERPWMAKYIDKQLNIKADKTYQQLGWRPTPRYHILRRLLFIVENKKAHPSNWIFRNDSMLKERAPQRPSIIIHRALQWCRGKVVYDVLESILQDTDAHKFPNLKTAGRSALHWLTHFMFQMLSFSILTRDRCILSEAIQVISPYCFAQGYQEQELKDFMYRLEQNLIDQLLSPKELNEHVERIHDFIHLSIQFILDEIEDSYDSLQQNVSETETVMETNLNDIHEIYRFVRRVENLCGDPIMEIYLESQLSQNNFSTLNSTENNVSNTISQAKRR